MGNGVSSSEVLQARLARARDALSNMDAHHQGRDAALVASFDGLRATGDGVHDPPVQSEFNQRRSSPPASAFLPGIWRETLNADGLVPTSLVGKHHRQRRRVFRAANSSTIARLFERAQAAERASAAAAAAQASEDEARYAARLQAMRAVSVLTSRPHTTGNVFAPETNTVATPSSMLLPERPATTSAVSNAVAGQQHVARPLQRTTELRLPQLKEQTLKTLGQGAALQVRESGLVALDDLRQRQAGVQYKQRGEALLDAAEAGMCADIRRLLKAQADVEYQDEDGFTPLIFASCNGATDAVRVLVEEGGADVRYKSPDGSSALHVAAQDGHVMVLRELLQHPPFGKRGYGHEPGSRANTDATANRTPDGPRAGVQALDAFLRLDLDIHPIFLAAQQGQANVLRELAQAGLDVPSLQNSEGMSAIDLALVGSHVATIQVLFELKADYCSVMPQSALAEIAAAFSRKSIQNEAHEGDDDDTLLVKLVEDALRRADEQDQNGKGGIVDEDGEEKGVAAAPAKSTGMDTSLDLSSKAGNAFSNTITSSKTELANAPKTGPVKHPSISSNASSSQSEGFDVMETLRLSLVDRPASPSAGVGGRHEGADGVHFSSATAPKKGPKKPDAGVASHGVGGVFAQLSSSSPRAGLSRPGDTLRPSVATVAAPTTKVGPTGSAKNKKKRPKKIPPPPPPPRKKAP